MGKTIKRIEIRRIQGTEAKLRGQESRHVEKKQKEEIQEEIWKYSCAPKLKEQGMHLPSSEALVILSLVWPFQTSSLRDCVSHTHIPHTALFLVTYTPHGTYTYSQLHNILYKHTDIHHHRYTHWSISYSNLHTLMATISFTATKDVPEWVLSQLDTDQGWVLWAPTCLTLCEGYHTMGCLREGTCSGRQYPLQG